MPVRLDLGGQTRPRPVGVLVELYAGPALPREVAAWPNTTSNGGFHRLPGTSPCPGAGSQTGSSRTTADAPERDTTVIARLFSVPELPAPSVSWNPSSVPDELQFPVQVPPWKFPMSWPAKVTPSALIVTMWSALTLVPTGTGSCADTLTRTSHRPSEHAAVSVPSAAAGGAGDGTGADTDGGTGTRDVWRELAEAWGALGAPATVDPSHPATATAIPAIRIRQRHDRGTDTVAPLSSPAVDKSVEA